RTCQRKARSCFSSQFTPEIHVEEDKAVAIDADLVEAQRDAEHRVENLEVLDQEALLLGEPLVERAELVAGREDHARLEVVPSPGDARGVDLDGVEEHAVHGDLEPPLVGAAET